MNICLINKNYNEYMQEEKLKPYADIYIYYDNSDIKNLHEHINQGDEVYITSYAFIHDDPIIAAKFKTNLDDKNIAIYSILESTVGCDKLGRDFPYAVTSGSYAMYEMIKEYRIA